jgi:hypothetical protein
VLRFLTNIQMRSAIAWKRRHAAMKKVKAGASAAKALARGRKTTDSGGAVGNG